MYLASCVFGLSGGEKKNSGILFALGLEQDVKFYLSSFFILYFNFEIKMFGVKINLK